MRIVVVACLLGDAGVSAVRADAVRFGSPAWFGGLNAQRGAAGSGGGSVAAAGSSGGANVAPNSPAGASSGVAQSVAAFAQAARAIAQAAQAQKQAAQSAAPASVADGLTAGGLWIDPAAVAANPGLWSGAALPTVAAPGGGAAGATGAVGHSGGKVVTVNQTAAAADLTWTTFNVGANTTLQFNQGASSWTVLNRVSDPNAAPSQILGAIRAPGEVLVLNPNGILFGSGAQVNVGALVASTASLAAAQFSGLTSTQQSDGTYLPVFTGAAAPVTVQAGALITTNPPAASSQRGGFVLLLGQSVENDGQITTANGQTVLAAGQSFVIRDGFGSTGANRVGLTSTTLGLEVAPAGSGSVRSTGLIEAMTGDITLTGQTIVQGGVLLSSTTVAQRGTIHLLTDATDPAAAITFSPGSLTAIEPEDAGSTATDSTRAALMAQSLAANKDRAGGSFLSNQVALPDQQYQSRIEIVSGGSVEFQGSSLTLSTGGQIALAAAGRVLADSGATLSAAGSVNTVLPAMANSLQIDVQGYDLRDAPANRDTGALTSHTISVSTADLVQIGDLQYTPGGLLEVSGYVAGVGHSIGEWTSVGGSIAISAGAVVAQPGAVFNISGGLITYAAGSTPNTWLTGSDGKLYNVNTAPANLTYSGFYTGFTVSQPRWGVSDTYVSPLIAPASTENIQYTVGRDGGTLTIDAPTTVMEATILAGVTTGVNQNGARPASVGDPFALAQTVVPLPGSLVIGPLLGAIATPAVADTDVSITASGLPLAAALTITTPVPADRIDTTVLAAPVLDQAGLGGLTVVTKGTIAVDAALTLADGGAVTLLAPTVTIAGSITARSGQVTVGNVSATYFTATTGHFLDATGSGSNISSVTLGPNGLIDTSGVFSNLSIDPSAVAGEGFVNGGPVTIDSSGAVTLAAGSVIDASAGGAVLANRATKGGSGGAISITADDPSDPGAAAAGAVTIAGTLRSLGSGSVPCSACVGGALTLSVPNVWIGAGGPADGATVTVGAGFFAGGFSSYTMTGENGVTVASDTQIAAVQPVLEFTVATLLASGGSDPLSVFSLGLPALYTPNQATAVLVQRPGASITLKSGTANLATGGITIGAGAVVSVDPLQSISLEAQGQAPGAGTDGQITIDGSLIAPAGSISVVNDEYSGISVGGHDTGPPSGLSIWLGGTSLLDVSAQAVTATDRSGRAFGTVPSGGTIHVGGPTTLDLNGFPESTLAFVVMQPGARIRAAGSGAMLDPTAGQNLVGRSGGAAAAAQMVPVASSGGSIAFDSASGIFLGGQITAPAGGAGAQGGTLSIDLVTPDYAYSNSPVAYVLNVPAYRNPRTLVIGTGEAVSPGVTQAGAAFPDTAFGQAPISTGQVGAGGFDVVNLSSGDAILFDGSVALSAGRSITLSTAILGATGLTGAATVSAPYLMLAGTGGALDSGLTFQRSISSPTGSATSPNWQPSAQAGAATLTVNAANIDVSGNMYVGVNAPVISVPVSGSAPCALANCPVVDQPGFASMTLSSSGDIRFVPASGQYTTLTTPGNLTLIAGQVYPEAGTKAIVTAGLAYVSASQIATYSTNDLSYNGTLSIAAAPGPVPAVPLTAGGAITLRAGVIDQGGVLRAPDGQITFGGGFDGQYAPSLSLDTFASRVVLLPGSVTSVSMAGLTIPFGGTSDGTSYTVNGATPPVLAPLLAIDAQTVQVQPGATIDISGGGVLAGAGFVQGRGGSTDILQAPLLGLSAAGVVTAPAAATNLVFAIVPGLGGVVAPPPATASTFSGPLPSPGDQITLGAGVPGLAAGTYTLLPSSDALLPGAYRVQLATTAHTLLPGAVDLGAGSYLVNGYRGVADTVIRSAQAIGVTVTSGAAVRQDAQYNETSYADFELAQAALFGTARASLTLPADAKTLAFAFPSASSASALALQLQGTVFSSPGSGGLGGLVEVTAQVPLEVIANSATPTLGMVSVLGTDLSGLNASTLVVGGGLAVQSGQEQFGEEVNGAAGTAPAPALYVRDGATLSAAQVFLVSSGGITIGRGASVSTIGDGVATLDSSAGLEFNNRSNSVLAVSNGSLLFAPASGGGSIAIGSCAAFCSGSASLLSAGTILTSTTGTVTLDPTTRLGTASLDLSASAVNFGAPPAGAAGGLTFSHAALQAVLAGDPAAGIPALRQLTLTASSAVNFYGSFSVDTIDPVSGQSTLASLQLNTPAIYGGPGVNASLTTGMFIWNGVATTGSTVASVTPGIWTPGRGSGSSSLAISASTIVLGYGPNDQPQDQVALGRLMLGFDSVSLTARQSIAGNANGSLSVYRSGVQDGLGALLSGSGGNLTLTTPLLTGAPGSTLSVTAGGTLTLTAPAGGASAGAANAQGAALTLTAAAISANTAIVLPSGQLVMNATGGGISLGSQSRLDLAGVTTPLFDQSSDGWGGDVTLQAAAGGVSQAAGGRIDVSASAAAAGSVTVTASGVVALDGIINGRAGAGYSSGSFSVRAAGLDSGDASAGFAALNSALDAGGVFGGRSFDLLTGDLTIAAGHTVTANTVSVSIDAGSLTVAGTVNASGAVPGTIRLSAGGGLTLAAGSVLDAHGSVAQVDGYGQSIDAENTGSVTLTSVHGPLTIATAGSGLAAPVINVSAPAGVMCALGLCGQVTLNAPRVNAGVAAFVPAGVSIAGAGSVVVAGFQAYRVGTISQAWFDQGPGADASAFMSAAVSPSGVLNAGLATQFAGLLTPALAPVFHLRPGVEIDSLTQAGGLTVAGDLDLSGARYPTVAVAGRAAGLTEPGALVIRSGDGLTVLGSINDGFSGAPALCQTAATCTATTGGLFTYQELAQPLAPNADGSAALSWSIRLVAGADLAAADSRIVLPSDALTAEAAVAVPGSAAATDPAGSIALYDPHLQPFNVLLSSGAAAAQLPGWSVIRTGTGDLEVLAGGSIDERSTYAIYTAGASPQLASGSAFKLARGTSTVPVSEILQQGTVAFSTTPGRNLTIPSGTLLTDTTTKQTFALADTVTVSGSTMFVSGVAVSSVAITPSGSDALPEPVGRALTVSNFPSRLLTAKVAATAVTGLVSTVLGPNGNVTNNGVTLESLADSYSAYYPESGGNLLISAGANISGYLATPNGDGVVPMDGVGNWLWRQGEGAGAGGGSVVSGTAWWINFGTLALPRTQSGASALSGPANPIPTLTGFTGIGTLGGGNVTILAGGGIGAGAGSAVTAPSGAEYTLSQALDVAVGSTGRLAAGATNTSGLVETGGGVLTIRAGGALNGGGTAVTNTQANGTLTDTRGAIDVRAASIGQITLRYGTVNYDSSTLVGDPRAPSPLTASEAISQGGPIVVPGDATVSLEARGDLVLGGVGDPTRLAEQNLTPAGLTAGGTASGLTWFSLWQPSTAITVNSAGGNLVAGTPDIGAAAENAAAPDNRFLYPPTLSAVAASGSIYAGTVAAANTASSIELAPSPTGNLTLLAAQSIYGDAFPSGQPQSFDVSGAPTAAMPTPLNAAFQVAGAGGASNLNASIGAQSLSLFAFGADTASGTLHQGDPVPARIYAGGDIVDLRYGETLAFPPVPTATTAIWYVSGKAVQIMAGGDVVEAGTLPDQTNPSATTNYSSTSGLILNNNASDVSVIQAGGEILYANAAVAGPGQLYVQAGGSIYQGNAGVLESLGQLSAGALSAGSSRSGGAGITVLAGAGTTGPDWAAFAQTYLAPAMGYGSALVAYLQSLDGYSGDAAGAPAAFEVLPIEQQRALLLQIYFDELRTSGREFTNPASDHFKSYITGRTAIATLFPAGASGSGNITLFGNSGVHTDFGGAISVLTPNGATTLGEATGPQPNASAGLLTQGSGDIDIYALGSVILGQSRVFTTFGGSIVIWSAQGDINAGNGVQSTQLFSTALIGYDPFGLVTLAPSIPTTGAGIATLAPIPGTPAGSVDLIAPLGVIDAGEAGIRASGNANLAALTVVNAANIQVGGKSTGLPTVAAPNVSALSAASATAAAAAQTAQDAAAAAAGGQNTQAVPSTISVDVLGFGE